MKWGMRIGGDSSQSAIIRNLTEVFRALSRKNWVSHISVPVFLGVAGFVFALRDRRYSNFSGLLLFPEKDGSGDGLLLLPGLQNLGNNCFLNVVLQALASCKDFRFFLRGIIDESESLSAEEQDEHWPLTLALTALLEELCVLRQRRSVLSPRKVMLALVLYVQNFNLTSQQDAAEAFLHLLQSLREELSDCYLPSQCTLSDIIASPNFRVVTPGECEALKEQERWQKCFLGPFDGILGSMLTCQSCSSQILLDFQFFHTLSLPAVIHGGSTIMFGCTLEDCLKRFFVAEKVENYFCSGCWHTAAAKYLLVKGADEMEIEKLRRCAREDSCDCRNICHLEKLPWSNNYSRTLKQLSIARCPKILCIHVQRASVNVFGELVKLQGHIAFPMVLDVSPFMTTEAGMNPGKSMHKGLHCQNLNLDRVKELDAGLLNYMFRPIEERFCSDDPEQSDSSHKEVLFDSKVEHLKSCRLYRLVAAVEHFGGSGSGHYTVYRSMSFEAHEEDCSNNGSSEGSGSVSWFSASDSEVSRVSENDVLNTEASLLFYERLL